MENGYTKNPPEQLVASPIMPMDARWIATNIEEVNLCYNHILELIENGAEMFADKSDACYEKQCQLLAHVEEILHKHQLLAEQYKQLRSCNDNSTAFNQKNVGDTIIGFSNESCFQTPDNKSIRHHVNPKAPSIVSSQLSGGGSSDVSGKEGSQYSAMSSDSDSETYKPSAYKSARSHIDSHIMLEHHFVDKEEVDGTDEGRFRRMIDYEEELSLSRKKVHLSESEVSRLQKELEELTGTFESQLNSSQNELQTREIAFEMEKKKVVVLQNRVSTLENEILNSNTKVGSLEMELDLAKLKLESLEEEITNLKSRPLNRSSDDSNELKNQLEIAQQQVSILDAKLDGEKRQTLEMQDKVHQYESDIQNRDDSIQELRTVLKEVTDKSRENELQLQSQISSSIENLMVVKASSNEWKKHCESLEEQLQQCEADMAEMRRLHEVQQMRWKTDINLLKTELNAKLDGVKRHFLEMQDKVHQYESDIMNRDDLIQELKTALKEVTDKSLENELQLQSQISSSIENLMVVEASSNEWEKRCESLEEQLQQCEADMGETRRLHEVQEMRWRTDIDLLKTELNEKVTSVEILNKDIDTLKLKYDVLEAELGSKDVQILQMEGRLHKLRQENVEMISASDSALHQYEDVMLKLKDLEEEVQIQHSLILDRAEDKREAIRQLCFTIEYYRNGYKELLQAGKGMK